MDCLSLLYFDFIELIQLFMSADAAKKDDTIIITHHTRGGLSAKGVMYQFTKYFF